MQISDFYKVCITA